MKIRQLSGPSGLRSFVRAPWEILDLSDHPQWVPSLRMSVGSILSPRKNPFFQNAERALFLAERDGKMVGRIAAIRNGWLSDDADAHRGFFGFFESIDDQDVAAGLFEAAGNWLRDRGCNSVMGPMNPSTNYEAGLLVDGFEHTQTFLTPWNPPFYQNLLESDGFEKAKDLLAWHLRIVEIQEDLHRRFEALTRRVEKKEGLEFGPLDLSDFDGVMRRCWKVYSKAWENNWGFCPLSVEEWLFIADEMKPLMVPEGTLAVQAKGEIVGFSLFLPDYNRAMLKDRSGRILPWNWLRLLKARRHTPWVRTMLTGVLPQYQKVGVFPLLLFAAIRNATKFGVEDLECSWILEDNDNLNIPLEKLGASAYRTWRVFERAL